MLTLLMEAGKMLLRRLGLLSALFMVLATSGGFIRGGGQTLNSVFTPAWQDFRLGAGGNAYGINIYSDNTILSSNDTLGGYLYKPTGTCVGANNSTFTAPCWQQLITATSLPASVVTTTLIGSGRLGASGLAACTSNTQVLYTVFNNKVYVSTNKGTTWVDANKTITIASNGGPINTPKISCDPFNPDIVYISAPSAQVQVSTNGRSGNSATWAAVSGTAPASGTDSNGNGLGSAIAFDPSSSSAGGFWQRFMICVNGTGCYLTTNGGTAGGGTYTLTTSGPTAIVQLLADKFGQFFVIDASTAFVWRFSSGAWSHIATTGSFVPTSISADPNSVSSGANNLAANQAFNGVINVSSDNGATWTNTTASPTAAASLPQPPWLAVANQGSGSLSFGGIQIAFDYANPANLWMGAGLGVWETAKPVASSALVWTSNNVGYEQLVTNIIISPPGNSPLAAVWDKGFFLAKNPDVYPSIYWNNSTSQNPIMGGWALDWCGGTANFVTGIEGSNIGGQMSSASSSDGGNNWNAWGSNLTGANSFGGSIACWNSTNWIAEQGQNTTLQFTVNGGSTWTASTATGNTGWVNNYANNRQPFAADRVTANEFYAVDIGTGPAGSQVLWHSTNSGATFTSLGAPFDGGVGTDQIKAVPGQAGNLFYITGFQATSSTGNLWKSVNHGTTWTKPNTNLLDVGIMGFGAAKPGGSGYPMLYAMGFLSTVFGVYSSADGGVTWVAINTPANQQVWAGNTIDLPTWMEGDANVYGRIYVGERGSGGTYIDIADACPWVNFSNTNPNASLTGTVSLQAQHSGLVLVTSVNFYVDGALIGNQASGSGTPTTYTQSWVTGGVGAGAHTLKVEAVGNGCTAGGTGNSFSIPVTTH